MARLTTIRLELNSQPFHIFLLHHLRRRRRNPTPQEKRTASNPFSSTHIYSLRRFDGSGTPTLFFSPALRPTDSVFLPLQHTCTECMYGRRSPFCGRRRRVPTSTDQPRCPGGSWVEACPGGLPPDLAQLRNGTLASRAGIGGAWA